MTAATRRRRSTAPPALRLAGVALAFLFAFPGVYLVYRALRDGTGPDGLLWSARTLGPLWRSLRLAGNTRTAQEYHVPPISRFEEFVRNVRSVWKETHCKSCSG